MSERARLVPGVTERDHADGPAGAVTLVEYGDYECHECRRVWPLVRSLKRQMGDRLRFVFRNFPLRMVHVDAQAAAEATEAAGAQGQFWQMHDLILEPGCDLRPSALLRCARQLGLDIERWSHDMRTHAFAERVQEDFSSGARSGVNRTPTFFVDGWRHDGPFDEAALRSAIAGARS